MSDETFFPQPGDTIVAQSGISGVPRTVAACLTERSALESATRFAVRDTLGDRWLVEHGLGEWYIVQSLPRTPDA